MADLYLHYPICLHVTVLKYISRYRDNFTFLPYFQQPGTYAASRRWVVDLEGNVRDVIKVKSWHLPGETEGK
jgi:hypothetical protein